VEEAERSKALITQRLRAVDEHIGHIEKELGGWLLFAKCMSNDGLIALSIDDAGPALSGLANDLLMACYGRRFAVSIKTQIETGKGEAREGFDIVVHDADSGDGKSVTLMSGGERVWVSCRSRHDTHYAVNFVMPSLESSCSIER
jgi:exonuclease SbcC